MGRAALTNAAGSELLAQMPCALLRRISGYLRLQVQPDRKRSLAIITQYCLQQREAEVYPAKKMRLEALLAEMPPSPLPSVSPPDATQLAPTDPTVNQPVAPENLGNVATTSNPLEAMLHVERGLRADLERQLAEARTHISSLHRKSSESEGHIEALRTLLREADDKRTLSSGVAAQASERARVAEEKVNAVRESWSAVSANYEARLSVAESKASEALQQKDDLLEECAAAQQASAKAAEQLKRVEMEAEAARSRCAKLEADLAIFTKAADARAKKDASRIRALTDQLHRVAAGLSSRGLPDERGRQPAASQYPRHNTPRPRSWHRSRSPGAGDDQPPPYVSDDEAD
eukprot:TRINITY_DN14012_c0_g1_i3.p1 TRINITY_DN14012_c0_g1~~TRINITY_DN14012_c0_g1_i3.p1  ORF type:complete len:347 (+),score=90.83 TRINITY_DN14012_c0_g1_i3:280-1320(+)